MRRHFAACLLIFAYLLTGCTDPVGRTVSHGDILLTLPADFADLSEEQYAENADFMYGRKTLVFMGLSEKKSDLQEMTLAQYTSHVISGNDLSCTPEVFGDGYLFSYEAPIADTVYTYITATFEGTTNFWILQFYCPSGNLEENRPEISIILESLQKSS